MNSVKIDLGLLVEGELYSAFVEPFVDVLSATKLAVSDIANPLATSLQLLNPFLISPRKIKEKMNSYNQRKDEINSKWKSLHTKINSDLSPDVQAIAFIMNPSLYLAAGISKSALKTSSDTLLGATGLGLWMSSNLGIPWDKLDKLDSPDTSRDNSARSDTSLSQLSRLFFLTSGVSRDGTVLFEQSEDDSGITRQAAIEQLKKELSASGIEKQLQEEFESFIASLEEVSTQFVESFSSQAKAIVLLDNVESSKDLDKFFNFMISSKLADAGAISKMKDEISNTAKKLADNDDFTSNIPEDYKGEPVEFALETTVGIAKKKSSEFIQQMKKEIESKVNEILRTIPKESTLKKSGNENSRQILSVMEDLKNIFVVS